MIQLRPGDLVAVRQNGGYFLFAILTRQILLGGHWTFVFHGAQPTLPVVDEQVGGPGFNAAVDFIWPKRENRIERISRGNDFALLMGPELLQQTPDRGQENYQIWRWRDGRREAAEHIGFTATPTAEELAAPHFSCIGADFACELAARNWQEHMSKWCDE